jgi:5'-nucleotidase (lipoprotein e(P4) family)
MKKTHVLIALLSSLFIFGACNVPQKETKAEFKANQNHLIAATLWQQTSAEAKALNIQNYKLARIMLDENLEQSQSEKPKAIITDLDETVIDNSAYNARMIVNNHPYTSESWNEWVKEEKAEAIPGAVGFFRYADSIGVTIIYLSNRADSALNHTINNLNQLQLPQIKPENILLKTDSSDKTERRNQILENYDVVLYLGDNLRDFSEDFGKRGNDFGKKAVDENAEFFGTKYIVFANPMYGEWEKPIQKNSYDHTEEELYKLRTDALDIKK